MAAVATLVLVSCGGGGGGGGNSNPPPIQNNKPTATLTTSQLSVSAGSWITLNWSSTNANSCTASDGWAGTLTTSGSQLIGPVFEATKFSIYCAATNISQTSPTVSINVTTTASTTQFSVVHSRNQVRDVAWDPQAQLLYVATGAWATVHPNSVIAFDPVAGVIRWATQVGSDPSALAISGDGQHLYVGFGGASFVRRFHLPDMVLEKTLHLNPKSRASTVTPTFAMDIAVAPGAPLTVAVTSGNSELGTLATRFDVFDEDVHRPLADDRFDSPGLTAVWEDGANRAFSLVGASSIGVYDMAPSVKLSRELPLSGYSLTYEGSVKFHNGRIYVGSGDVFDAGTLQLRGTFPTRGIVEVDRTSGQAFVANYDTRGLTPRFSLTRYEAGSFQPAETITFPGGSPLRVVRWGTDGLALVSAGGLLTIISGRFVASGGGTVVGLIPGADPCCIPRPLLFDPTTTMTGVTANDIAFDSTHGLLFASLPATDPAHPNTVAVLDPASGAASNYIATAAQPGGLSVTADNAYLLVATVVGYERYTLPGLVRDVNVSFPDRPQPLVLPPDQIQARPGHPEDVLVSYAGSGANHLFEDGTWVLPHSSSATWVRWTPDGNGYYGLDSSSTSMELWLAGYPDSGPVRTMGGPFTYPLGGVSGYPFNMSFQTLGNLLIADTGAIFDPASGSWPGTLPIGVGPGYTRALATIAVDVARNRAYASVCDLDGVGACSNHLVIVDLATYLPLGEAPVQSVFGWGYRLEKLSETSFAMLTAQHEVAILTSPNFAR